jgi:hypothetical protein
MNEVAIEVKVSDMQDKINSQIDLIRQECTEMCVKSQEDTKLETKFERIIAEKDTGRLIYSNDGSLSFLLNFKIL